MPWRSLDEQDLRVLRAVRLRGQRGPFAGFGPARGWASPVALPRAAVLKLVELGHLQTGCGCVFPCNVALTKTGYAVLGAPLPPRSWSVWHGVRLWP